jgi:hypothetical protein
VISCPPQFAIDTAQAFCNERRGYWDSTKLESKNMNWKKFFVAFVAAFGFMFLFGFLWYGKLMHGVHQEVPMLWRTDADFGNHFSALIFGHIVMAFFLTLLCARFVPDGGAGACATLAILVVLVYIGNDFILYAVQPLTTKILCGWIVGDLIQFGIAGAVIGAMYKSTPPART